MASKHMLKFAILSMLCVTMTGMLKADDAPVTGDLKKLQGTWVSETGADSQWIFEDDNLKATVNGEFYTCKVILDEKAKPIATMNLKVVGGSAEALGKMSKAIYKIEGERVMLCVGLAGGEKRPIEFKTEDGVFYAFELKKKN